MLDQYPQDTPLVKEEKKQEPIVLDSGPMSVDFSDGIEIAPEVTSLESDRRSEFKISELAGGSDYDNLQTLKDMNELERRSRAITDSAYSDRQVPAEFSSIIQEVANAPLPKKTNGEVISANILTNTDNKVKKEVSTALDVTDKSNTVHEDIKKNLGAEGSLKSKLNTSDKGAYEVAHSLATKAGTVDNLPDEEGFSLQSLSDFLTDSLEFVNPIGGEAKGGMDLELWESTKDILSGDFDYDAFDKRMESNYGGNWEGRFAGFLIKEAGIDAGLIALAITGVGAPLAVSLMGARKAATAARVVGGTSTVLKSRLASIGARTAIVAVGGGSVQAAQNAMLDRDLNFSNEVLGRAIGQGVMEGAGFGAQLGYKKYMSGRTAKEAAKQAADKLNTKVLSEEDMSGIIKAANNSPSSTLATLTRASLVAKVKQYDKITGDAAATVAGRSQVPEGPLKDEIMSDLSLMLGKDINELETLEFDLLLPLIRDNVTDPIMEAATKQGMDDVANSRSMILDMFASITGKTETRDDMWRLYFGADGPHFRSSELGVSRQNNNLLNKAMKGARLSEMSEVVGRSLPNFQAATRFTDNINKGLQKMAVDINKGLTKKEAKSVEEILSKGGADEVIYNFTDILPTGMNNVSKKVQDAYVQTRMLLDTVHTMTDQALLRETKNIVFSMDGKLVQIIKSPRGQNPVYKEFSTDTMSPVGKELSDKGIDKFTTPDTILPYKSGYVPRMYNKHRFSILVIGKDGTVSREAMFNSRVEARNYVNSRKEVSSETVIRVDTNGGSGLSSLHANQNSMNIMRTIPDEHMAKVSAELEAAGLTPDDISVVFKGRDTQGMSPSSRSRTELGTATTKKGYKLRQQLASLMSKRSAKQDRIKSMTDTAAKEFTQKSINSDSASILSLQSAIKTELIDSAMPSTQAIREYIDVATRGAGMGNFRRVGIDHFKEKFADVLHPNSTWHTPKFKSDTDMPKSIDGAAISVMKDAANRHSVWLNKVISGSTRREKSMDDVIVRWGAGMEASAMNGSKTAAAILRITDILPNSKGMITFGRFQAAFTKLLTFNMPHIAIQMLQATNTVGSSFAKDGIAATKAVKRSVEVAYIHGKIKVGSTISPSMRRSEGYKAYEALVRSGYTADLDISDVAFNVSTNINPSVGSTLWDKAKGGVATTAKYGGVPFRIGEGGNRLMAFTFIREQYIRALSKDKATIMGLDGKPLSKNAIDSPEFLETVVEKAKVLALDMGKTAELEALSGVGSLLGQFKQVGFKTISLYNSSALSGREKFGAAFATFGAFGTAGIPFAVDLLKTVDMAWYYVAGDGPADRTKATDLLALSTAAFAKEADNITDGVLTREGVTRMLTKGGINALSEGEINILSRASLSSFWSDAVDVNDPGDVMVLWAVAEDMIAMEETILGLGGTPANVAAVASIFMDVMGGKTFQEAYAEHYDPKSTIARLILDQESTTTRVLMDALRATGKVFSSAGGISRIIDAQNRDELNTEATILAPNVPNTYYTSGLNNTGVLQTYARDMSFWLGISPGAVVAKRDKKSKELMFQEAKNSFTKDYQDFVKKMGGNYLAVQKRKATYIQELFRLRDYAKDNNIELVMPKNIFKHAQSVITNTRKSFSEGVTK